MLWDPRRKRFARRVATLLHRIWVARLLYSLYISPPEDNRREAKRFARRVEPHSARRAILRQSRSQGLHKKAWRRPHRLLRLRTSQLGTSIGHRHHQTGGAAPGLCPAMRRAATCSRRLPLASTSSRRGRPTSRLCRRSSPLKASRRPWTPQSQTSGGRIMEATPSGVAVRKAPASK